MGTALSQSSRSMNATVNWLKRRVSLSTPTTPSSSIQTRSQPHSNINHHNNITITTLSDPTANEPSVGALNSRSSSTMNITASRNPSNNNIAPMLMQRDVIDPSSPLSLLAATSNLTTFPYGELQALNAKMNTEAPKTNGINGLGEINGISSSAMIGGGEGNENGVVAAIPNPLLKQKLRSKDRINSTTVPSNVKALLPSAMPIQPSNLAPDSFHLSTVPSPLPVLSSIQQRIVTTSGRLPRTRSVPILRKQSTSLSSIQNTRSSKRLKIAHPTSRTSPTTPPKLVPSLHAPKKPETPSVAAAENKKRVLPVRQGHIDILDGEISLLSTPQRLDSICPNIIPLTFRPSIL